MKAFSSAIVFLALFAGCASHGNWSKFDQGAWINLDERIGTNELNYYIKEWGEPVSRKAVNFSDGSGNVMADGVELLWLWKSDGTGPSDQSGQGWELFLAFNERGAFRNWRIGAYRTTLMVADVIAAVRKNGYRFDRVLLQDLRLSDEQHLLERPSFWYVSTSSGVTISNASRTRWHELYNMQTNVQAFAAAILKADTAARNLDDRLATDDEIFGWLEEQFRASKRARPSRSAPQGIPTPGVPGQDQAGLLGRGFLGPYTPNAYGPGMNADATGRPFVWQPMTPGPQSFDPFLQVKPNAYGPGIGMDQYGRPVRPACPPGWAGPC